MISFCRAVLGVVLSLCTICACAGEIKKMAVLHPIYGNTQVSYEKMSGYAITEGDIILKRLSTDSSMPKASIIKLSVNRWPNGVVPYQIDASLPQKNRDSVMQAIALWEQVTFVRFVPVTKENETKYPDYVVFMPDGGRICASYVGRYGGKQYVQLSSRCSTMTTVHEIGHVLGLWHEQSRIDRDNYVRIMWENIDEHSKYNFDQHLTDGTDHGPYNYQSIMHYSADAFSKNGEKTIIPLVDGVTIGQRDEISPLDIQAVNTMYPESSNKEP